MQPLSTPASPANFSVCIQGLRMCKSLSLLSEFQMKAPPQTTPWKKYTRLAHGRRLRSPLLFRVFFRSAPKICLRK